MKQKVWTVILLTSGAVLLGMGSFLPLSYAFPEPVAYGCILTGFGLVALACKSLDIVLRRQERARWEA